jgi:hypothetical protein
MVSPKVTVNDWDTNPDNNKDIAGINIDEGCPAANLNDSDRNIMAQIAAWIVSATGPILKVASSFPNITTILDPAGTARKVGYRDIPQNTQTGAYVLALTDIGEHVYISTGGVTVPLNATVAFPIGSGISIVNNSASPQSITATGGVTLWLAGTANSGTRVISARGVGTLLKTGTNEWYLMGAGVS